MPRFLSRRATSTALIAFATIAVAACTRATEAPIRLAAVGPWSRGGNALQLQADSLAVDAINRSGALGGRRLELLAIDDSADATRAVAVAQQIVADPSVLAVLGHVNSRTTLAAGRVYEGHVPAVAATASAPDLTGFSSWFFRVVPSDSSTGRQLASLVAALGWKRMAMIYENDSYGRGLATAFTAAYPGALVTTDPVDENVKDFTPYLEVARRRGASAVFVATSEDIGLSVVQSARAGKYRMTVLGSDGWAGLAANPTFDGVVLGLPFVAEGVSAKDAPFVDAFRGRFHAEPDAAAALAYDAATLVGRAITARGASRRAVRDYLREEAAHAPFDGVTGSIQLQSDGDPRPRDLVGAVISGGRVTRLHR